MGQRVEQAGVAVDAEPVVGEVDVAELQAADRGWSGGVDREDAAPAQLPTCCTRTESRCQRAAPRGRLVCWERPQTPPPGPSSAWTPPRACCCSAPRARPPGSHTPLESDASGDQMRAAAPSGVRLTRLVRYPGQGFRRPGPARRRAAARARAAARQGVGRHQRHRLPQTGRRLDAVQGVRAPDEEHRPAPLPPVRRRRAGPVRDAGLWLTGPDGDHLRIRLGEPENLPAANEVLTAGSRRDSWGRHSSSRPSKGLWDHQDAVLSIINLEAVNQLEQVAGRSVDPLRFRANLYLSGLPARQELSLVGRRVRLGDVELEVLRPTDRCRARESSCSSHVPPQRHRSPPRPARPPRPGRPRPARRSARPARPDRRICAVPSCSRRTCARPCLGWAPGRNAFAPRSSRPPSALGGRCSPAAGGSVRGRLHGPWGGCDVDRRQRDSA